MNQILSLRMAIMTLFLSAYPLLSFCQVESEKARLKAARNSFEVSDGRTDCDIAYNDATPYVRFMVNNDFLKLRGITDRYYTTGEKIELYFPLGRFASKALAIFPHFRYSATTNNLFALTVGMDMYTPSDISEMGILYNDRPYAGYRFIGLKCVSSDFDKAGRLTTEYQVGQIGPNADQKSVQIKFHKIFDFEEPRGWDNQIDNDFGLNINLQYEQLLLNPVIPLEVIAGLESNLGTVTNYIGINSTVRFGAFNDYFLNEYGLRAGPEKVSRYANCSRQRGRPKRGHRGFYSDNMNRKTQIYLFAKPSVRFVLDNSLLEGGITSYKSSPYVIGADSINHFVFGGEFGVHVIYRGIGLSFSQQVRSPEFMGANTSHWGTATLTFKIR